MQEVREPVTVKMGERNVDMSFIQANVKTMKKRAVNGDARAQEKLIDLAKKAEDEVEGQKVQIAAAMIEYKYAWLNEFKYLGRLRLERPILPIDPETLFINPETGDVESLVPLNQEEQENYSWALDKKQKILDEISDLRKFEITSKEDQDLVRDEIAHLQGRIDLIDRHFPISEVDYSDWL